ncbi:ATP-binding cassette domain-containing protein [Microbacterium sp. BWT-B31]|uniref:ATP-binding cassette domain-containing protein n=1 Tax=Microbacterium sp. BWT-B31 TaxID=3232072 RepID=UPI0035276034
MPEGLVLEFSGVTKRFGGVTAVSELSARVEPGHVTGFLGPNGAGKTTSLRVILGLVRATSGRATIGGVAYAKLKHPLQTVGAVLEASSFHPGRTGANHLRVYARAASLPDARVDEALGLVGLADAAGRKVGGYSLGMRQRLGLAYALLGDPGVLVLDEPTNGLDPEGIKWMRSLLRTLAREGRTILVSSHLLAEVQQTVDALLILANGRLVFQGGLEELADPSEYTTVVDAPDRAALAAALDTAGISHELLRSGITVRGHEPTQVGAVAATAGVALSLLQRRGPALEEVFLDLVNGARVHASAAVAGVAAVAEAAAEAGSETTSEIVTGDADAEAAAIADEAEPPTDADDEASEASALAGGFGSETAAAPGASAAAVAAAGLAAEESRADDEVWVEGAASDGFPDVAGTGATEATPGADDAPGDAHDVVEAIGRIDQELAGDTPAQDGAPAADETPTEDRAPDASDTPTEDRAPDASDTPTEDRAPDASDTPTEDRAPDAEETPTEERAPVASDTPTEDRAPVDADPDVEAIGEIDEELSGGAGEDADRSGSQAEAPGSGYGDGPARDDGETGEPLDDDSPVHSDRPWEQYVKTDSDREADRFFAAFDDSVDGAASGGGGTPVEADPDPSPDEPARPDEPGEPDDHAGHGEHEGGEQR